MSCFLAKTKHPLTGKIEEASWIDNYFGLHKYGVGFSDGGIYNADSLEIKPILDEKENNKTA